MLFNFVSAVLKHVQNITGYEYECGHNTAVQYSHTYLCF